MKPFNVNLKLIKQLCADENYEYFLHAITQTNKTDYRENGYAPLPTNLDDLGVYQIGILIDRINDYPDFTLETPIIHTLKLGQLPISQNGIQIKVTVYETDDSGVKTAVGDSVISTADADEDIKPIGNKQQTCIS